MNPVAYDAVNNCPYSPERAPEVGEYGLWTNGKSKTVKQFSPPAEIPASETERQWRNSELVRTDDAVKIPDYPNRDRIIAYRVELRDYPAVKDFPQSIRPTE